EAGTTSDNDASTASFTTLSLPPVSDLRITDVSAPAAGLLGSPIPVSWTTTNDSGGTIHGSWTDSFYLSPDTVLDAGDRFLGQTTNTAGSLAVGATHTQV